MINKNAHDSGRYPSSINERLIPMFRYLGMVRVASVLRPVEEKHGLLVTWSKYFQDNPAGIASVVLVFAYFLGALNLWFFTWFVGRPDVFMQSLELGPGLVALMVSGLIPLSIIIGILVMPSWFFVFPVEYLEFNEGSVKKIAWCLFAMFASGVVGFVLVSAFLGYGVWLLIAFVIPSFIASILVVKYAKKDVSKLFLFVVLIVIFAFLMVLNLAFSIMYMMQLYEGKVEVVGDLDKFIGWLLLAIGALFPGLFACIKANEGMAVMIKHAVVGLLGYVLLLVFIIPKIFGVVSATSMGLLGVSEQEVGRYLVDAGQYPVNSLDAYSWAVKVYDDNHYSLNAFSLYDFGPVNLLCPADLSEKNIWEIKSYTHFCIPFRQDSVRKLDAVVEFKNDGQ